MTGSPRDERADIKTGTLGGQSVSIDEFASSELASTEYTGLTVVDAVVIDLLDLKWTPSIGESQSARLTGGYVLMPAGQPMANQYVCVLSGDSGIEPRGDDEPSAPSPSRPGKSVVVEARDELEARGPSDRASGGEVARPPRRSPGGAAGSRDSLRSTRAEEAAQDGAPRGYKLSTRAEARGRLGYRLRRGWARTSDPADTNP